MRTILFDSIEAAKKIADRLGGKWDGCNAVEFETYERRALKLALKSLKAKCCYANKSRRVSLSTRNGRPKEITAHNFRVGRFSAVLTVPDETGKSIKIIQQ